MARIVASTLALLAALASPAAAAWSPARALSPHLPDVPAVAINARGTAVLAGAGDTGVWVGRLSASGAPGPRQVVPGSGGGAALPAVVVGDGGRITVAWLAGNVAAARLMVASWQLGAAPARGVAVSRSGWAPGAPVLTMAPGGRALLAWFEFQIGAPGEQRAAVAAAAIAPGAQPRPEILAEQTGHVLDALEIGAGRGLPPAIAWISHSTFGVAPATLMSAQLPATGEPAAAPLDGSSLDELHVLTGPRGGLVAVWRVLDPSGSARIVAASRAPGAAAFEPVRVLARGRRLGELVAAIGRQGDVRLAWTGFVGPLNRVFAMERAPSGRWGPAKVATARGRSGEQLAVGVDGRGRALLLWGSLHGTLAARAERGRPFAHRQTVSSSSSRVCWAPQVVVGDAGDAVATFVCTPPRGAPHPAVALHEITRYTPPR